MLPESQMSGSRNHLEGGCYIIAQCASARSVPTLRSRTTFPIQPRELFHQSSLFSALKKLLKYLGHRSVQSQLQTKNVPGIWHMPNYSLISWVPKTGKNKKFQGGLIIVFPL